jgi:hypothetical protein
MRIFRAAIACCLLVTQVGCADILPWPGFESHPSIFSYTEQLPAAEVAERVRCELAEFLREEQYAQEKYSSAGPRFLDPNKGAQVQLKLTTDLQGSVTWLGVNLKGLGLGALANLVTQNNNAPSLQLKAQGKSTQTSEVDFVIPQTPSNEVQTSITDKNGNPVIKPIKIPENLRLPTLDSCSHGEPNRFIEYAWFRLWLSDALKRYKERLDVQGYGAPGETFADRVCQPKLTIATQFQLLFDVSAGTNIFHALPIILPVSGLNIDASPDYTHFIQIIFSLRPYGKYDETGLTPINPETKQRIAACNALQTSNPPASAR